MNRVVGRHLIPVAEPVSAPVAPGQPSDPAVVDLTVSLRPSFRGGTASPLVKLVAHVLLRVYVFLFLPAP